MSHSRLSHSKQLLKKNIQWLLHYFFSLMRRYLKWPHWKTHRMTDCTHLQQASTKMSRQCLHTWFMFSHWWHQSASHTSGWQYTSLILVVHRVKVNEAYYHNVMLLQQFLSATCHILSEFFIFHQDSAVTHTLLRQWTFLPVTLPDVDRFYKFLQSKLSS